MVSNIVYNHKSIVHQYNYHITKKFQEIIIKIMILHFVSKIVQLTNNYIMLIQHMIKYV